MLYRLTRAGLLAIGGGFDGLVEHAMRVERARRALDEDLALSENLVAQKTALLAELDEIAMRRAPLQIERQAAEQARALSARPRIGGSPSSALSRRRPARATTSPSTAGTSGPDTESRRAMVFAP